MTPLPEPARFCPRCGLPLATDAAAGGSRRPTCPDEACGYRWFPDPKVATGVVAERDGRILLVRRNHEPASGRWAFPSGFVDAGEVVEAAAAREAVEETGAEVRIDRLLGVYSEPDHPVVFIAYAGTVTGGRIAAGPEAIEVAFFALDDLPPLAFSHDDRIIEDWRRSRETTRAAARGTGHS